MSVYDEATFSVNEHTEDGEVLEEGFLVHLGHVTLKFESVQEMDRFADKLRSMSKEIQENY